LSNAAGILNGMTGAELKQLREDLGDTIGRPLSVNDFAKPESGGGTILEWENGYGTDWPGRGSPVAAGCRLRSLPDRRGNYQQERRRLLPGDDASRDHSPDRLTGPPTYPTVLKDSFSRTIRAPDQPRAKTHQRASWSREGGTRVRRSRPFEDKIAF
jgi:hypothetical protein